MNNKEIITQTLGTTLINYYRELKRHLKIGNYIYIDELKAKIQAHKQARKEELEFLKPLIDFFDVCENDNQKTSKIKCDLLVKGINRIEAIEMEIAYSGEEE